MWMYGALYERLHGLARDDDCLIVALCALEAIGSMPPGSARQRMASMGIVPQAADMIIKHLDEAFRGAGTPEAACRYLDHSAASACGDTRDKGIFYTPKPIARHISELSIYSYALHRASLIAGKSFSTIWEAIESLGMEELAFLDDLLINMRVLDSSCGSGVFLEAVLEALFCLRARISQRLGGAVPGDGRLSIIENCLYGMEVDHHAADVAALRLWLLSEGRASMEKLKSHIVCKNALFEDFPGRFEVIVGNPPYRRIKSMFEGAREEGKVLKKSLAASIKSCGLYHYQEGNLNLYKLFMERNLSFLRDGGSMGLIVPSSFLNESTSERLRRHMFESCAVEEIVEFPERSRIFRGVNQGTAIIVLNKSKMDGGHFRLRPGKPIGDGILIGYVELGRLTDGRMEVPLLAEPSLEWPMLERLKGIPPFMGTKNVPPVGEISVGNLDETLDKNLMSEEPTGSILVKGIHLSEYHVDLSPSGRQPRWVRKKDFLDKRPSALSTISCWRIIGRNTQNKACKRRLKFALLPPGYICTNSIKQIIVTDRQVQPLYLLGLLNSSTLNWHFELFCSQNNIRNYRIEALPIIRAPQDVQNVFSRIASLIMSASQDHEFLDEVLMDSLVFELYFKDEARLFEAIKPFISLEDESFIQKVKGDQLVQKCLDSIMEDERFKLIRKAAFKC